jgi:IclR family pca regulon transcriptional regulator
VKSVERAIALLLALDANSPSLDAATLSERTGLSRSTVYRLLATLERTGIVHKHGTRFEIGQLALRLAGGYRAANHIGVHARAVLDELAREVGTGVALAVLDGDVVVTVEVGNATNGQYVMHPYELGRRIPAAATSVGRMLLAFAGHDGPDGAEQIRRQGYALTTGLLEAGVRTIAVPVYDGSRAVVAGLVMLADAHRTSAEQLAGEHLDRLRAAADRLTELDDLPPTAAG